MTGRETTAGAVFDVVSSISSVRLSHCADLDRSHRSGVSLPTHSNARIDADRIAAMSHAPHHAVQPKIKESKARPYQPQRADPRRRLLADGSVRHIVLPAGADPLDQVQPSSRCVRVTDQPPLHGRSSQRLTIL